MTTTTVAIARAESYTDATVEAAIRRILELIGGLPDVVRPGCRVFLKINQLPPPSTADRGVVTHPVFVKAAARILKEAGADITVGDDIESGQPDGFTVSGVRQACLEAGVKLVNLREAGFVATPIKGRILKQVYLSKLALEADLIVNLPKLKTHALTAFTGGVKNIYGCLPQGMRIKLHGDHISPDEFALMLTDVYAALKPQLTLMDAVMAMQGEGPANGSLYPLGLVLAGTDSVAVDAVACRIIGLPPHRVDTLRHAADRGLGTADLNQIEVVGEKLEAVTRPDFKLPASATMTLLKLMARLLPRRQSNAMMQRVVAKPKIIRATCTGCGACVKVCPAAAMKLDSENISTIDYKLCIRCLCCYEACRESSIEAVKPFITRLASASRSRKTQGPAAP
jgi:uncharacterized protein (DUF362 family)/Pyruvate/2-oxoacid:ferredoxin oxidoreductase delta subunit